MFLVAIVDEIRKHVKFSDERSDYRMYNVQIDSYECERNVLLNETILLTATTLPTMRRWPE